MTDTSTLQGFADRWAEAFNTDIERMARELYAPDAMLNGTVMGTEKLIRFEQRVLDAAPQRRIELVASHVAGDVVTVEGVLRNPAAGEDWKLPFCAVLQVRDGKVVRDATYTEFTRWPGMG